MNDKKRIALNTLVLYAKLIISIVISFMASRYVLKALGASDYGLYNVVGGVVAMMNLLATSMIATSYRYVAVEMGKGENGNVNKVYNTIFIIHVALALLLILIGETVGIYYVNNYLNVAVDKIPDAKFVLHLSLATTAFTVISIPADGLIVAREKFIYTSILKIVTSLLTLAICVYLCSYGENRLRLYAIVLAIIHLITPLGYQAYCWITCKDFVRFNLNKNIHDYLGVLSFTFWMFIGAIAHVGRIQGASIIMNLFFGTVINAAFGFASQVSQATGMFTSTLRQAAIPQIMKNQGGGNEEKSLQLVYVVSRFSFLLMLLPAVPLLFTVDYVLKLWLKNPPEFTGIFIVYLLINGLISNFGAGFDASIQATGKVRKNQIGYSLINLALLPAMYIAYKLFGAPVYANMIIMIVCTIITLLFQIYIMRQLTSFDLKIYLGQTVVPCLASIALAIVPLYYIRDWFGDSISSFVAFCTISEVYIGSVIFLVGLKKNERHMLWNYFDKKVLKRFKRV